MAIGDRRGGQPFGTVGGGAAAQELPATDPENAAHEPGQVGSDGSITIGNEEAREEATGADSTLQHCEALRADVDSARQSQGGVDRNGEVASGHEKEQGGIVRGL